MKCCVATSWIMLMLLCVMGALAAGGGGEEVTKAFTPRGLEEPVAGRPRHTGPRTRGKHYLGDDEPYFVASRSKHMAMQGHSEDPYFDSRYNDVRARQEQHRRHEEPYFDASMSASYIAYLGKTAILTCVVHAAKTDKSVSWIRGRDLRILTVGAYTYTTDLRFEALHQTASIEWTLRIRSVQLRDQGNYECQIATKPIRTFSVFLKVMEPWVEVVGAPDIFVNTASMINLTCVVHHAPYPPEDVTWYHGNQSISYTSSRGGVSVVEERGETTTSFLLLQHARASDSGTFTCQPEGMEAAQVTLHVLDGERPAAMQTNSSTVITCQLSALVLAAVIASTLVL